MSSPGYLCSAGQTLMAEVGTGDTVGLIYEAPDTGAIRDTDGLAANGVTWASTEAVASPAAPSVGRNTLVTGLPEKVATSFWATSRSGLFAGLVFAGRAAPGSWALARKRRARCCRRM